MRFTQLELRKTLEYQDLEFVGKINDEVTYDKAFFDSRECIEDSIFVALDGEKQKGISFIKNALEYGARALIVDAKYKSQLVSTEIDLDVALFLVNDSLKAFDELAKLSATKFNGQIIGVIGSVGKTTTKDILAHLSSASHKTHRNSASYNNETGVPLTLCGIEDDCTRAIVEMGESHFGDLNHVASMVNPSTLVITNVAPAHTEYLGDLDGVARTMNEAVELLGEKDSIIIPANIERIETVLRNNKATVHKVGFNPDAKDCEFVVLDSQVQDDLTTNVTMKIKDSEIEFTLPLFGKHFVENAALAITACVVMGDSIEKILSNMSSLETQGHRMRKVQTERLTIFDDCYNANPASMKANIEALTDFANRNDMHSVMIMGPMRELGESSHRFHLELAEYALKLGVSKLILIGDENYEAANQLKDLDNVCFYPDVTKAQENIIELIEPNMVISVKASRGPDPQCPYLYPIVETLEKLSLG